MSLDPIFESGRTAMIFGAASGIGLAAVDHCLGAGMRVVAGDRDADTLEKIASNRAGRSLLQPRPVDVADYQAVLRLRDEVVASGADIALVMNNAGHGSGAGAFDGYEKWRTTFDTNFWGVVHGVQVFTPALIAQGRRACIVNTGSKQGLTNPPGDLAYNTTKAAIRTLTEGLQHSLRSLEGCRVSAHLLIPGFTYSGLIARRIATKPDAAWTPEQVVARLVEGLAREDFYILCPDNETTLEMDALRIAWAAQDIAANRPALSRWHPDFKEAFAAHMNKSARS